MSRRGPRMLLNTKNNVKARPGLKGSVSKKQRGTENSLVLETRATLICLVCLPLAEAVAAAAAAANEKEEETGTTSTKQRNKNDHANSIVIYDDGNNAADYNGHNPKNGNNCLGNGKSNTSNTTSPPT